jgi:hypothetical protein
VTAIGSVLRLPGDTFWHFPVDDSAACGHPLDIPRSDCAAVANAVPVLDGSSQNIRDRLNAAMGMPRNSRQEILRYVIAKIFR